MEFVGKFFFFYMYKGILEITSPLTNIKSWQSMKINPYKFKWFHIMRYNTFLDKIENV